MFRVVREEKWHTVVEYNVTVLLEGDIEVSYVINVELWCKHALSSDVISSHRYTKADNSVVVATDSSKRLCHTLSDILISSRQL